MIRWIIPVARLNHGSKAVLLGVGEPRRGCPANMPSGALPGMERIGRIAAAAWSCGANRINASPTLAARLAESLHEMAEEGFDWPLVILVDDAAIASDQTSFLWTVFTRFNPAADIYAVSEMSRHHIAYKLPLVIDARMKPGYPDELFPREDIVQLVDRRWSEYKIG